MRPISVACLYFRLLTNRPICYIIKIQKARPQTVMPKECIYKNNASFDRGRYFFMEITKSNRIIINDIMYSLSIAITPFARDDGITAQLLRLFWSYPINIIPQFYNFCNMTFFNLSICSFLYNKFIIYQYIYPDFYAKFAKNEKNVKKIT